MKKKSIKIISEITYILTLIAIFMANNEIIKVSNPIMISIIAVNVISFIGFILSMDISKKHKSVTISVLVIFYMILGLMKVYM